MPTFQHDFPELGGPDPDAEQPLPEPRGEEIPLPPFDPMRLVKERQRLERYQQEDTCWLGWPPYLAKLRARERAFMAKLVHCFRLTASRECNLLTTRRQAEEDLCWFKYGLISVDEVLADHTRRLNGNSQPDTDDPIAVRAYFAA